MKSLLTLGWLAWLMRLGAITLAQNQTVELPHVQAAIQLAWQQNSDLEVYQLQQQRASSEWRSAQTAYLPKVTATANGQWNADLPITPFPAELGVLLGEPGQSVNVQFGQAYQYNAGLNLSQPLLDWQAMQRSRLSQAALQTSAAQTEAFRQSLAEQVALSYYTALVAQEALAVSETDLRVADSILLLAQDKFDQGVIDRLSLNQAQINLNHLRQSAATTQILLEQSRHQLAILLGLGEDQRLTLSGSLTLTDLARVPDLNPDRTLKVVELQVRQAEQQVKLQQSAYLPKLSFYAYLGQQQFQDEFALSFQDDAWSNYNYLGLNLSVPIFSGFSTRTQVKIAQIDRDIALAKLAQETARSQAQDRLLTQEYEQSLIAARAAYDNFVLNQETSQLSLQRYQQGVISLDAYFLVFDDYLKAENAYLNALSALYAYHATIIARK